MSAFDDLKLDFLMQSPEDLRGLITVRAINCLKDGGFQTVFTAIRNSERELLRIPNMGRKSLAQFIELVQAHGLDAGETEEFFSHNKEFFLCPETRLVHGNFVSSHAAEKKITTTPARDPDEIFIDDYRARVKDFLNPSLSYKMQVGAHQNAQLALETSYYISLLPAHLRVKITPEFARAAFHTMEMEAELSGPQEQLRRILIKAVERKFGLE